MLTYRTDSLFLIIAIRNSVIYGDSAEFLAGFTAVHQLFKVGFCKEAAYFPLRRGQIVPEVSFKAV